MDRLVFNYIQGALIKFIQFKSRSSLALYIKFKLTIILKHKFVLDKLEKSSL